MVSKKNILILTFYFALSVLILGCTESTMSELATIKIPDKTDDPLSLSEMAKSVQRVQLETTQGNYLGYIDEVKLYNKRLYLADGSRILIFDLSGNFIQKLGRQGEGPGEYSRVTSMDIDDNSGNIYVSAYNKILVYNTDYELVEERKLGYPIQYLKILNGKLFIVSEEIGVEVGDKFANQTNLYELETSFEISDTVPFRTILLDQRHVGGYGFRYWLSEIKEGLFVFMPVLTPENMIRDTLYQIKDKMVISALRFHFERPQSLDERGYQTLLLYNIVNSSSYYILEYDQDWERFMFLYDKKNNAGFNLSEGLIDDEGDPVFLRPLDLNHDVFYYIKKVEYADSSIEEQNPEIGIVKLK